MEKLSSNTVMNKNGFLIYHLGTIWKFWQLGVLPVKLAY